MSKRDEQIARMKGLMTYGISNTTKKTPVTESIEGPDGKIYAIIREGSKFYIKSANKGSELVTESFNYIGGYMNKKNNEFSSYNQASKNLELKVRSLNESYGINKPIELLNPDKKEVLMVEMTDTMKASIARYREIMNNSAGIMKESNTISMNNTGNPEAPKTTSYSPNLGKPFDEKANASLDKDMKTSANNPEKQGEPFGDNTKTEEYKDAQYVPKGSVANQKPSGGKVVRVNENSEFEETIEECDEWGSCGVPETGSVGEIGDDAPFTETLDEDADEFVGFADDDSIEDSEDEEELDLDDIDLDLEDEVDSEEDNSIDDIDAEESLDDEGDLEADTEVEDESEIESLRKEVEHLRNLIDEYINRNDNYSEDDVENEYELDIDTDDELEDDEDDIEFDDEDEIELEDDEDMEDEDENIFDSVKPRRLNEEGTKLNVFGKHPGYRKKVMSLPQTGSDKEGDYKDWNDESVYSEEPFGSKIGKSSPFEKMVEKSINTVLESLKKKI